MSNSDNSADNIVDDPEPQPGPPSGRPLSDVKPEKDLVEPQPAPADIAGVQCLCNKIGCKRALCSFAKDPHLSCIDCGGFAPWSAVVRNAFNVLPLLFNGAPSGKTLF